MKKFRRKSIVVKAVQILPENDEDLRLFFNETEVKFEIVDEWMFLIYSVEGRKLAEIGDWLICGENNEVYTCRSNVFEAMYDPIN